MIYKKIYLNQYKLYSKQTIDKLYSPKSENNLAIIYQKKKKKKPFNFQSRFKDNTSNQDILMI